MVFSDTEFDIKVNVLTEIGIFVSLFRLSCFNSFAFEVDGTMTEFWTLENFSWEVFHENVVNAPAAMAITESARDVGTLRLPARKSLCPSIELPCIAVFCIGFCMMMSSITIGLFITF